MAKIDGGLPRYFRKALHQNRPRRPPRRRSPGLFQSDFVVLLLMRSGQRPTIEVGSLPCIEETQRGRPHLLARQCPNLHRLVGWRLEIAKWDDAGMGVAEILDQDQRGSGPIHENCDDLRPWTIE